MTEDTSKLEEPIWHSGNSQDWDNLDYLLKIAMAKDFDQRAAQDISQPFPIENVRKLINRVVDTVRAAAPKEVRPLEDSRNSDEPGTGKPMKSAMEWAKEVRHGLGNGLRYDPVLSEREGHSLISHFIY